MPVSVGNLTSYGQTLALNALATGVPFSIPNLWLALYTVAPTDTSAGTEVTGGAYYRLGITFLIASGVPASTMNTNEVFFPGGNPPGTGTATADWGIVDSFA